MKNKKNNSNSDWKFKNNVFKNSENPSSDVKLSENEQFIQSKRKINDQPIIAASVQSKVSIQNVYIKLENYKTTVIVETRSAID